MNGVFRYGLCYPGSFGLVPLSSVRRGPVLTLSVVRLPEHHDDLAGTDLLRDRWRLRLLLAVECLSLIPSSQLNGHIE